MLITFSCDIPVTDKPQIVLKRIEAALRAEFGGDVSITSAQPTDEVPDDQSEARSQRQEQERSEYEQVQDYDMKVKEVMKFISDDELGPYQWAEPSQRHFRKYELAVHRLEEMEANPRKYQKTLDILNGHTSGRGGYR